MHAQDVYTDCNLMEHICDRVNRFTVECLLLPMSIYADFNLTMVFTWQLGKKLTISCCNRITI